MPRIDCSYCACSAGSRVGTGSVERTGGTRGLWSRAGPSRLQCGQPRALHQGAGYPPGVFAVSIPDRPELLAFDTKSNIAAVCTRTAPETFELPNGTIEYARFRCPGASAWSLEVVFVDGTEALAKMSPPLLAINGPPRRSVGIAG